MKQFQIILLLLAILTLSGCTIVNLTPPEKDDKILQRQLEKHFGPSLDRYSE